MLIAALAIALAGAMAMILIQTLSKIYLESLRATQLREEVLGLVAHDLKSPLAVIQMSGEMVTQLSKGAHPKLPELGGMIQKTAARMNRQIQDLLDFEKIETGHLAMDMKPESVIEILTDAIEAMEPLARSREIQIAYEGQYTEREIFCDRDRILQVFSNLVGNALKFSAPNGKIFVGATEQDSFVRFWVRDNGPGIAPDHLPRLFERYWQAKQGAMKGNGLGLLISKGIVEQHLGDIGVSSKLGEGATFYFTLPSFSEVKVTPVTDAIDGLGPFTEA